MKRLTDFLFAIAVYSVFVSTPAHAYLDTATISIILQAVAGAFASVLLFGKVHLTRLMSFFRRPRPSAPAAGDERGA